jgi:hypothetical protein
MKGMNGMNGMNAVHAVTALLQALPSPEADRPASAHLRYLRRKPGRGLVAVFGSARPEQLYTVTVDEDALAHGLPPLSALTGEWPGVLEGSCAGRAGGVTVQAFPADRRLPALATAMAPSRHPLLREALDAAVPEGRVTAVAAEPLRYKPGDRCVLRLRLTLDRAARSVEHSLVGKLYRDPAEATAAAALLRRLGEWPWSPRLLSVVEPLGLVLTEDIGGPASRPPAFGGMHVLRAAAGAAPPEEPLTAAAQALADLHTSTSLPPAPLRTGQTESSRAARRGDLLAAYLPRDAERIRQVVDALRARLAALPDTVAAPAHGSYKPSQLLFRDGRVFVIDFDQFCHADPALDVGYFRAYLRPAGLWYRRAGTRTWFEAAANRFDAAYVAAARERGMPGPAADAIVARAAVYEAALLLKIAARRPNRLHGPRPGEVGAVLDDIVHLLSRSEPS